MSLRNCPDCLEDYEAGEDHRCAPTGPIRVLYQRQDLHKRLAEAVAYVDGRLYADVDDFDISNALINNVVEDALQQAYMAGRQAANAR